MAMAGGSGFSWRLICKVRVPVFPVLQGSPERIYFCRAKEYLESLSKFLLDSLKNTHCNRNLFFCSNDNFCIISKYTNISLSEFHVYIESDL